MEWRAGMEWDEFVEERRDEAIDNLLHGDSVAVVDEIINCACDKDDNGEYAREIMALGLMAYMASKDKNFKPESVDQISRFFESSLLESPFIDKLIDYKLNEMWDMGL